MGCGVQTPIIINALMRFEVTAVGNMTITVYLRSDAEQY
jgi:hypothetical protein